MTENANEAFAAEIGSEDLVHAVGGNTQSQVGGEVSADSRAVAAPSGVVEFIPTEMIVRVGAGTLVSDLDATLAQEGQLVAIPFAPGSSVGGTLAVGSSGLRQLRYGLVRDTLLETHYVRADGRLIRAGAPVVKNVSGFDVCRLLVGSLGTLGLMAEVVLRTRPIPAVSVWLSGELSPKRVIDVVRWPHSLISSRVSSWVLIEGHRSDVERISNDLAGLGMAECSGPPEMGRYRRTTNLGSEMESLGEHEHALVGTGTILTSEFQPAPLVSAGEARLNQSIRNKFDPNRRFNRRRQPWRTPGKGND